MLAVANIGAVVNLWREGRRKAPRHRGCKGAASVLI